MNFINFTIKSLPTIMETIDIILAKKLKYVFILLIGVAFGYAWAWLALN